MDSTWKDVRRWPRRRPGLRGLRGRAPAGAGRLVLLPRLPAGGYVRPGSRLPGRAIDASAAADHALGTGIQRAHVARLSLATP